MVDRGTNYQVLERVKSKNPTEVFCAFVKGWARHYGVPRRVVVDDGNEFKTAFLVGVSGLGALVTVAGVRAPWQNARTERHGGLLKEQLALAAETETPENVNDLDCLVDACVVSKNRYSNRSGFSPQQRVFGTLHRLPGSLISDDDLNASLMSSNPEREYYRAARIRQAAATALMRLESRTRIGAAANAAPRKTTVLPLGSWVYFWFAPVNAHAFWKGPAVIVGEETQCVWISFGGRLIKCPREHVRLATSDEAEGASLLEGALSELKAEVSQRGPHRFVDLTRQRDPPREEEEVQKKRKALEEDEEGHERESKRERNEPSASSETSTLLHMLQSSDTDIDHVNVFANTKTPGQGEVAYRHLDPERQKLFDEARKAEFESLLTTGAIRICDLEESRKIRKNMPDRIIPSRWVDRDKPSDKVGEPTIYKSRWTLQGFKDPDILDVTTAAPTPASIAVTCALQFCSSSDFEVHVGDIKTAFLQGHKLVRDKGPLFATQPKDGNMHGLEQDQVVELLKDVYGLNSAPASWRRSLKHFLLDLGYVESVLDPCVFVLPSNQTHSWSTVSKQATKYVMPSDIPHKQCKSRVTIDIHTGRVLEAREINVGDKDLVGHLPAGPTDTLTIVDYGSRGLEAERCQGIVVVEVDDILAGGPRGGHSLHARNMICLQERFKFGKWQRIQDKSMYIGRQIREDR
eukprot:6491535-Amphidinium_carterae.1